MKLWMIAAILLCGMTMLLTSCSSDDDNNTTSGPGPLAQKLSGGAWYCIYEASGIAMSEDPISEQVPYIVVVDIYHFEEDGTGDFQRCFFGENDNTRPALVQGTLGYGIFTYTSHDDGLVNITLTNDWNQSYPKQWNVIYANDAITAVGVDQQLLTLEHADYETQAALNTFVEQNGSGKSKYDVNNYKPKSVDNSRWMKSLANSRLVADLSLPGSHDACTCEGWQSKVFSAIAESTAKTQDLTIKEQLKVGMRVFDLRPERVFEETAYVLRCAHGYMFTELLVSDFFQQLKEFLTDNPTEFCILTVDLSATFDKEAWGKEFNAMISSTRFRSMFADFKPRLTVGEMRGKVLILSKYEYAPKPIGGYCYG